MGADRKNGTIAIGVLRLLTIVVAIVTAIHTVPASASVPGAPIMGIGSYERAGATVRFTPPASDGGSPITGYTVTSNPAGGIDNDAGSTATSHLITGLNFGTAYTFTVKASNSAGTGPASPAYNYVTPRPYAPTTGTINNLVVFIRFSDQPEFSLPLSYYDNLFNAASNSLKNFYSENSYNALTVNSTFYPTPTSSVVSYQDSNPTSYYQPYNAVTNPIGYQGAQSTAREAALVTNALNAIAAQIPGGLDLDGDNDGYIDHIDFQVYSTNLNPLPVLFYSRATFDTTGTIMLNGKHVGSYTWVTAPQDVPENYLAATEIHEMGHSLGYPDLRANNGRAPVGNWDVMSLSTPVHSGAYLKSRFTKWIPNIPEITTYGTYTINDLTQGNNNSYKIKLPNSNEYLILEYRRANGSFESTLPGSGLCITRVNEAAGMWGNSSGPPFFLYYFRPNGTLSSDGPSANMFNCLSAETGRTQFNDFSNPACFLSDGTPCGISITNIGSGAGSSTSFSFSDPSTVTVTRQISGYLYNGGSRVSGATVTLSGDATGTVTTGNLGTYLFTVNDGGNYTVTPTKANMTFTPVSKSFSAVTSDQVMNFPATYNTNTISGTITSAGSPVNGVTVNCTGGNYPAPATTNAAGFYSFTVTAGNDYSVWASKSNYLFTPNSKALTNVTTNQVQNFTTNIINVNLTGTITYNGAPLSGVTVTCPGASSASQVTTDSSGNYSFSVAIGNGSSYTVTPSSASYAFLPISKTYSGILSSQAQNFTAGINQVADKTRPLVSAFSVKSVANTLSVPVTAFTASDNVGVSGYLITATSAAPLASATGWSVSAPTSYTATTAGAKTLYAWAKDAADNVSLSKSALCTIDTTIPVLATFTVPKISKSLTVGCILSATDNLGVAAYQITETPGAPTAADLKWTAVKPVSYSFSAGTADGAKTLYAWALDKAGNVSLAKSAPVTLDTTAPAVTSFSIPALAKKLTVPVTAFTASDNVAVSGYLITATSTAPLGRATTWKAVPQTSFTAAAAGTVTLYAWVKDSAGNVSTAASATVSIDIKVPVVSAFSVKTPVNSLTIPITALTASDNTAVAGYLVSEVATAPAVTATGWSASAPTSYTATTTGAKTLRAWVKDAAGNVSAVKSTVCTIDMTSPVLTAFTVPALSKSLTVGGIALSATDNIAVAAYQITETSSAPTAADTKWAATKPVSYTFGAGTSDGPKSLYAWAMDKAGNVSLARSASVTLDTTAPAVTSFSIAARAKTLTVPVTAFAASDNVAVSRYQITATSTAPLASATTWKAVPQTSFTAAAAGSVTLYAWVKDSAGNVSTAASAMVNIDMKAPVVSAFTVTAPVGNLTVPITAFTASDNTAVTGYQVNEVATAPAATATGWNVSAPANYTVATKGAKTLYAWAKDAAGNVSLAKSVKVTVP